MSPWENVRPELWRRMNNNDLEGIHATALGVLNDAEALLAGLEEIIQWSEAYPLDVFPEPDFGKAQKLLKDGGMTLDGISASNMRHVITEVAKIAKAALPEHLKAKPKRARPDPPTPDEHVK